MTILQRSKRLFLSLILTLLLVTTTACGSAVSDRVTSPPSLNGSKTEYAQIEQGNTPVGHDFGVWVVQASRGLIRDAYVRDDNKLGVVLTPQVSPTEVRTLARSLVEGFHKNFPRKDLTVLVYAPDKQLILTAEYNDQTKQIVYGS